MLGKKAKAATGVVVVVVLVVGFLAYAWAAGNGYVANVFSGSTVPADNDGTNLAPAGGCTDTPAATYSAVDALQKGISVGGITYIKQNGDAPVTSLASPTFGDSLQFWNYNNTAVEYLCELKQIDSVACGANKVQAMCYKNATTVSFEVFDIQGNTFLDDAGDDNNLTMGADAVKNVRIDIQGTAKESIAPLGGCLAVEYPSTIVSFDLTGAGLTAGCPYQYTYTVQATTNTYKLYTIPPSFDKAGLGDLKQAFAQIKAGASNPNGLMYFTIMPAYYYTANDGNFYLDIEKAKNSDTTKTFGQVGSWNFKIE